ncbi:hypothetical protein ACKKBF_B33450 [Auxenochlorella protothecoides x Auxenochlorella symbiontica]
MDDELLRDLLTLDGDFSAPPAASAPPAPAPYIPPPIPHPAAAPSQSQAHAAPLHPAAPAGGQSPPAPPAPHPAPAAQGQAPSRTLSRSVAPFLAKFSPAHWHMLFGALHKYDSGSKARLEAIFVQRYPKLKAAAATSTEAYVAVGFKMLEALLEFLPEDRLISFMHKCVEHVAEKKSAALAAAAQQKQQQQQQQHWQQGTGGEGAGAGPSGRPPSAAPQHPLPTQPPGHPQQPQQAKPGQQPLGGYPQQQQGRPPILGQGQRASQGGEVPGVALGRPVGPVSGVGFPGSQGDGQQRLGHPAAGVGPVNPGQQQSGSQQPQQGLARREPGAGPGAQRKAGGTKRGSLDGEGGSGQREGKRARAASRKDRDGDIDEILGADAFIDMEQETDTLMAGLQVQRTQGLASVAASQTLSEWRLGNECVKQMRAAGLKVLKPECFEVIQRAFQSQAETLLRRAMAVARHRQDNARRQPGVSVTHDPRRGVLGLERAARAAAEAKLAAEREALLKAAGSRRADEETKERAQKAKAELAGRAQASAANAAVAATLGGKGGRFARFERLGAAGLGGKDGPGAARAGAKKGGAERAREGTPPARPALAERAASGDGAVDGVAPSGADGADRGADGQDEGPDSVAGLLAAAQAQRRADEERRLAEVAVAERAAAEKAAAAVRGAQPAVVGGAAAGAAKEDPGAGGPGRAKLFGGPAKVTEETETLTLPDLLTAMERDRHYAKSSLLYTWRNRLVQG